MRFTLERRVESSRTSYDSISERVACSVIVTPGTSGTYYFGTFGIRQLQPEWMHRGYIVMLNGEMWSSDTSPSLRRCHYVPHVQQGFPSANLPLNSIPRCKPSTIDLNNLPIRGIRRWDLRRRLVFCLPMVTGDRCRAPHFGT